MALKNLVERVVVHAIGSTRRLQVSFPDFPPRVAFVVECHGQWSLLAVGEFRCVYQG